MNVKAQEIASQVRTANQAREVIANLLTRFVSKTAFDRIVDDAQYAKQSVTETVSRTAGNLLTSFVVRKPSGYVESPSTDTW